MANKPEEPSETAAISEKPKKRTVPRDAQVEKCLERFLVVLATNGGVVSKALKTTKLGYATAYKEFKDNEEFANKWLEALDLAQDELVLEARRRATKGTLEPIYHNGKKVGTVRKFSDTLLIFLLKQGEAKKKWRQRIKQTGEAALKAVQNYGVKNGLAQEQIIGLQDEMIREFEKISLI